jgi:hypothetical protein
MVYYRNVYDHLVRMTDLTESYRESVAGLLDAYLSVTSNRLSQVMKVLTIISTIFLPLSVITGFFGMNFQYLPGLSWEHGVTVTAVLMAAVSRAVVPQRNSQTSPRSVTPAGPRGWPLLRPRSGNSWEPPGKRPSDRRSWTR